MSTSFAVPQNLVSFKPQVRSFTIINSGPREKSPMFVGNLLTIPPVNVIGPHADTDADGQPIPGTRVISDTYVRDPEFAEDILVFDAVRAVCHILGLQPGSDGVAALATSPFALAGLSLLPRHAPKEQWKGIASDGEKRAFVAEVKRAQDYLKSIDEVNAIRKKAGLDPTVPDMTEYRRAQFVIEKYNQLIETSVPMAPHQVDAANDDLEFLVYAKAKAYELAAKAAEGKAIDKVQMAESLMTDPEVLAALRKNYRIRKVGEMPKSRRELEKAAAEKRKQEEAQALAKVKADLAGAGAEVEDEDEDEGEDPNPGSDPQPN